MQALQFPQCRVMTTANIPRNCLICSMQPTTALIKASVVSHCLVSFTEGDTELAVCAKKVHEMQAICGAFSYLLAANSVYTKAYASVCEQVCEDCEKECKKHEKHVECDACAKACAEVVDQIKLRLS